MQVSRLAESGEALETAFSNALCRLLGLPHRRPDADVSAPPISVAIALSGGADSMALTRLAQHWAQQHQVRLTTLTIDHGLRPESAAEAAQVAQWMQARGIAHRILTPLHADAGNNVMQAARRWRYDALAEYCRKHDILHCLIAHHADDQLETAMLQQQRGVTADGGSGMAEIRHYRGVRFVRPLLAVAKAELLTYLRHHQVPWVDDPTNQRAEFARTRARQQLLADAALRQRVGADYHAARAARHRRDHAVAVAASACVTLHPGGWGSIDRRAWMAQFPALAETVLANLLRTISGAENRARRHEILALAEVLRAAPTGRRSLQHCDIRWTAERITLARELSHVANPITLRGCGETRWDQRFHVRYRLPEGVALTLRAMGEDGRRYLRHHTMAEAPLSTPTLWHLDEWLGAPHIHSRLPSDWWVQLGFSPAKSLAATPFW